MSVDQWLVVAVGVVTLAGFAARGVRRMWHLMRKVNRLLDQTLGAPDRPSLMDRVEAIESKLDEHLDWHGKPGGRPAGGLPLQPNGPRRRRDGH